MHTRRRIFTLLGILGLVVGGLLIGSWIVRGASALPEGSFSIAVIPDTQIEVLDENDHRMEDRAQWLVDKRSQLGLAYVLHTGDVVNWGALVPEQFEVAKASFATLDEGGLPYALAIGNHDTFAVGHDGVAESRDYGGSAYADNPECQERFGSRCQTKLLIRDTEAFNAAFPVESLTNVGGTFEPGKTDNMWTTFRAEETDWLVMTLEFFPRKEAVAWAAQVVASHPQHNVIVQTHAYLNKSGEIEESNGGYGAMSAQYLFDNLIKVYPNIKLVFSGHVGQSAHRVDTGIGGNTILSFLGAFHSDTTNPVTIVTIDTDTGSVKTKVVAPSTDEEWEQYSTSGTISVIKK